MMDAAAPEEQYEQDEVLEMEEKRIIVVRRSHGRAT